MLADKGSALVPIIGGIVGGSAAVLGASKWNAHPGVVAAGAAAAGLAAASLGKEAWMRQAGTGAMIGAAVVGAVPFVVGAIQKPQVAQAAPAKPQQHRGAEGDNFITRQELNEALSRVAEQQQAGHCDLLTALDEIKKIVANAEQQQNRALPAPSDTASVGARPSPVAQQTVGAQRSPLPAGVMPVIRPVLARVSPFAAREAAGEDDYMRNAYGDDDERNAYVDDERNANVDEYERNAYGDDGERNADLDERNADFEERNADLDERNADFDERNADLDERNADLDERNADFDERNADVDDRNADVYGD